MKKELIMEALKEYPKTEVEKFAIYIVTMATEKDKKTGELKNAWINRISEENIAKLYERVKADGLVFDGVHITLQRTGISYDYIAYKNKMYLVYPESMVDVGLVYEGDEFDARKESGTVIYNHKIVNPFSHSEQTAIGGYCVIKNKRGDFITLLSKDEISKHRRVAKTDYIWKEWFTEMALKTLIKKACKLHFADIFASIEHEDNENYELENPLDLPLELKAQIDECKNMEELKKLHTEVNVAVGDIAPFNKYIHLKSEEMKNESA